MCCREAQGMQYNTYITFFNIYRRYFLRLSELLHAVKRTLRAQVAEQTNLCRCIAREHTHTYTHTHTHTHRCILEFSQFFNRRKILIKQLLLCCNAQMKMYIFNTAVDFLGWAAILSHSSRPTLKTMAQLTVEEAHDFLLSICDHV